jgi:hypothetical protein
MHKRMATNPKPVHKPTAGEQFEAELIEMINQQAAKMSPERRAEADRKTREIAARVRVRAGKR